LDGKNVHISSGPGSEINNSYKLEPVTKDKLPDQFLKSVQEINDFTKEYLSNNPTAISDMVESNNELRRGISTSIIKSKSQADHMIVNQSIVSTSIRRKNAGSFAGDNLYNELRKTNTTKDVKVQEIQATYKHKYKTNLRVSDKVKQYMNDNITVAPDYDGDTQLSKDHGMILSFNLDKLQKDNRIFAILTGNALDALKKQHPAIKFRGGEGEVVIIT
jgi:hypothetical protein